MKVLDVMTDGLSKSAQATYTVSSLKIRGRNPRTGVVEEKRGNVVSRGTFSGKTSLVGIFRFH